MKVANISTKMVCLLILAFVLSISSSASAQDPCASAIKASCAKIQRGPEQTQCLLKAKNLPEGCRPVSWENCAVDGKKFCSNVKPGEGKVLACLVDKKFSELSESCRKALEFASRPVLLEPPKKK